LTVPALMFQNSHGVHYCKESARKWHAKNSPSMYKHAKGTLSIVSGNIIGIFGFVRNAGRNASKWCM